MGYIAAVIMTICGVLLGYYSCQIRLAERFKEMAIEAERNLSLSHDPDVDMQELAYLGGVIDGIEKCQEALMKS